MKTTLLTIIGFTLAFLPYIAFVHEVATQGLTLMFFILSGLFLVRWVYRSSQRGAMMNRDFAAFMHTGNVITYIDVALTIAGIITLLV